MSQPAQPPDPPPDANPSASEEAQPFVITLPDDPASGRDWYLWAAVLALIALVAFWPAISGTFLWDDDQYVTQNRALLDAHGLQQIWKIPPGTIQYYPLTFTMLWIEHHFWENNSLGYRVVNLILHAGAAVILWRILRRLSAPAAWAAAAIWAVHPLQAESVCWISEGKNILSGILALASVLFYLEFVGMRDPDSNQRIWNLKEDWQTYAVSAGFFLLAMLSKTAVCIVPVALLIILWWKRRISLASILGLTPMLAIAAALAWETSRLETDPNGPVGASGPDWQLSFAQRLLIAGRDLWFYLGKLLAPIHQSFVYPRQLPNPSDGAQWVPVIAAVVLVAALALGIKKLGSGPLAAVLCYIAAIFPALGFFNVYPFRFSFVADHYQYLAGIPLIVAGVWIAARILSPLWNPGKNTAQQRVAGKSASIAVLISAVLVVFGTASWFRAAVFAEPATLWEDVLKPDKNPQSWLAASSLARIRSSEAKASFEDAARYLQAKDEDSSKASASDAIAQLDESDRLVQAVLDNPATPPEERYRAYDLSAQNDITRLRSPDSDSPKLLGHAGGQLNKALSFEAARIDPLPYYDLGLVDWNKAQAIPMRAPGHAPTGPKNATTRPYTPRERQVIDAYEMARDNFEQAIDLSLAGQDSPRIAPEARRVLPLAALQRGNVDWTLAGLAHGHNDVNLENRYGHDAEVDFLRAVQLNPTSVDARYHLALALENVGDLAGAKDNLITILRDLDHRFAPAYNEVGRVILESRPTDMAEFQAAVESFRAALDLDPTMTDAKRNLVLAMKMLSSTRPATQATTRPASMP
jgi:tetratricopeptide (TPR) repeat protein